MTLITCPQCRVEKLPEMFKKKKARGLFGWCQECRVLLAFPYIHCHMEFINFSKNNDRNRTLAPIEALPPIAETNVQSHAPQTSNLLTQDHSSVFPVVLTLLDSGLQQQQMCSRCRYSKPLSSFRHERSIALYKTCSSCQVSCVTHLIFLTFY